MKKNIKYIVLNNGLELIGNVKEPVGDKDLFDLEDPFRVLVKPMADGQNIGCSLVPYLPMVKDRVLSIRIADLLHLPLVPSPDLEDYYLKSTSNIILPNTGTLLNG